MAVGSAEDRLFLSAAQEIVLADGTFCEVGGLLGQGLVEGIGWLISNFRKQNIEVLPVEDSLAIKLYGLASSSGRSIMCGEETQFLGPEGWYSFAEHARRYKKRCRWLKFNPYIVNCIEDLHGREKRDQDWVDTFTASLVELSRRSPYQGERGTVTIPAYVGKLDKISTNRFLKALFDAFARSKQTSFVEKIDYSSQQRMFNLFARSALYSTTSRGKSRIHEVGVPSVFPSRNNRGGWWTSNNLFIRKDATNDPVVRGCVNRYRKVNRDIYETLVEVRTQIGNFVEKSFICRTSRINPT